MLTDEYLSAVTARLFERREEGAIIQPAKVSIGEWEPRPNRCHENVTIWCCHNENHKPVRGWLHFNLMFRFTAHSVIENEYGELLDITPSMARQPYPFIRAEESEAEYIKIVDAVTGCGIQNLDYRPPVF